MTEQIRPKRLGCLVAFLVVFFHTAPLSANDLTPRRVAALSIDARHELRARPISGTLLAQSAAAVSPLKRRDLPPPTIRPQLVSRDPAGDDEINCLVGQPTGDFASSTRAIPSACIVEITDNLSLSFQGFATSDALGHLTTPLAMSLNQPDGTTRQIRVSELTQLLYLQPGMPLGVYSFSATGSGRTESGGFTLRPASKRIVRVAFANPYDLELRLGQSVIVHIAGYRPFEPIQLYLYRYLTHRDVDTGLTYWQYATALSSVVANARGEASISFPTQLDDPTGSYLIVANPPQQNDMNSADFEVTR